MKRTRTLFGVAAILSELALLSGASLVAQTSANQHAYVTLTVTPDTRAAVSAGQTVYRKMRPLLSARRSAAQAPVSALATSHAAVLSQTRVGDNRVGYGAVRYPAAMLNFGGPTVASAEMHAIFMQQTGNLCAISACWGAPESFLRDLGRSDFIHVADQYVGDTGDERYTVGQGYISPFQLRTQPFTDADMQATVIAAAEAKGQVGYGHIYDVFLPPGVDVCLDSTFAECYSPDNAASFYFCAYHGSVDVPGLGHLLYAVQPYQNVPNCGVRPGTPNGSLIDSTNDALVHETLEVITDPDGDAWWNSVNVVYSYYPGVRSGEIGDVCEFLVDVTYTTQYQYWTDPVTWSVAGRIYATQPIYSNDRQACTTAP